MVGNSEKRDAVASAIRKERHEGEYIVKRFQEKLKSLEEKYEMDTEKFLEKFNSGELGDSEDFFEWKSIHKAVKLWKEKIRDLKMAT